MENDKYIYCPNKVKGKTCATKIAKVGKGKFHKDLTVGCPKCKKLIKYTATDGEVKVIGDIPIRTQDSGVRLY